MATRTLNAKYRANDDAVNRKRLIFYHSEDKKEIYYGFEDEAEEAAPEPAATAEAALCRPGCCPYCHSWASFHYRRSSVEGCRYFAIHRRTEFEEGRRSPSLQIDQGCGRW